MKNVTKVLPINCSASLSPKTTLSLILPGMNRYLGLLLSLSVHVCLNYTVANHTFLLCTDAVISFATVADPSGGIRKRLVNVFSGMSSVSFTQSVTDSGKDWDDIDSWNNLTLIQITHEIDLKIFMRTQPYGLYIFFLKREVNLF